MRFPDSRWWGRAFLLLLVVLVAIQFVPYGRDHINPPVVAEPAWDSPATRTLAQQACFDCHSNQTEWPAYSRVAPISWFLYHDVVEGRAALNFSEWQRPQEEASDSAKEVTDGEMPPRIYQLMHAQARLSDADRDRLVRGLMLTFGAPRDEGKATR